MDFDVNREYDAAVRNLSKALDQNAKMAKVIAKNRIMLFSLTEALREIAETIDLPVNLHGRVKKLLEIMSDE